MEVVVDAIPVEAVAPVTRSTVDITTWETIEERAK